MMHLFYHHHLFSIDQMFFVFFSKNSFDEIKQEYPFLKKDVGKIFKNIFLNMYTYIGNIKKSATLF